MERKIFFRADGSPEIGLGHLVRCIALAEMLKQSFLIVFVCKEIPVSIVEEIATTGFNLHQIKEEGDFLNILQGNEIVVLDHYGLSSEYQKKIKNKGCKLVCIDDLHEKLFSADIIINHAPGIIAEDYKGQIYTQFALGLEYVLLRPVFLKQASIPFIEKKNIDSVFVSFGGADPKNITIRVAAILKKDFRFKKINIVIGETYLNSYQLKEAIELDKRFATYSSVNAEKMCQLLTESQLKIVPASGILQETLAVGGKVISGAYTNNQKYVFENYLKLSAFETADDFTEAAICRAIDKSFDQKASNCVKVIDGKSNERLLHLFKQLDLEYTIQIRNATFSDLELTFSWAANKLVRAYSLNRNDIKFDEHSNWFSDKLHNELSYYFIVENSQEPIGSVRFDIEDNVATISYLLAPQYQNKGLGSILLKKGIEEFQNQAINNSRINQIVGFVMPQNIPSIKIFERFGFKKKIEGDLYKFQKKSEMKIDSFDINDNSRVFIIAELSANHNGSIEIAIETIRAAKRAGADCVKLQTYTADTITIDSDKKDFIINGTIWNGSNLHTLYNEAYTPWEWHETLFKIAQEEGLICFSSPFDASSVDFLEKLGTPAYKIASFEITDIPLIEKVAAIGKPIIISTGIATDKDIELALETCYKMGNRQVALLKCTSSYPAPVEEANIVMIQDMAERFGVITGLSDHTIGSIVPIVSVCFGARIIEKHFIIDRAIGGPDASFSMNEAEFAEMVKAVREAEKAIGTVDYELTEKQKKGKDFSKSLYVVQNINEGEIITSENVRSIRPGFGMHPKFYAEVMGKKVTKDLEKGDRLEMQFLSFDHS